MFDQVDFSSFEHLFVHADEVLEQLGWDVDKVARFLLVTQSSDFTVLMYFDLTQHNLFEMFNVYIIAVWLIFVSVSL